MTLPTWPATLPQVPVLDGSAVAQLAPDLARTSFDDGPDRVRRRNLLLTSKITRRFKMSAAQLQAFQDFHAGDLNAGARRFTMPVWKPGLIRNRTVRLTAVPAVEERGTYAVVTLSLDVWDF